MISRVREVVNALVRNFGGRLEVDGVGTRDGLRILSEADGGRGVATCGVVSATRLVEGRLTMGRRGWGCGARVGRLKGIDAGAEANGFKAGGGTNEVANGLSDGVG